MGRLLDVVHLILRAIASTPALRNSGAQLLQSVCQIVLGLSPATVGSQLDTVRGNTPLVLPLRVC